MDLAFGSYQSGVASYVIGSGSRILNARIRFSAQNLNFIGDSRVLYKSCSLKRRKNGEVGSLFLLSQCRSNLSGSLCRFRTTCQPNDSLAFINGSNRNAEVEESSSGESENSANSDVESSGSVEEEKDGDAYKLEDLRELLQKALKELEVARLNSTMFEEKAQRISELAIALKDEAENARNDVISTVSTIQDIIVEEAIAKEAVQKATMALSMAETRLQLSIEAVESRKEAQELAESSLQSDGEDDLLSAQEEIKECKASLERFEAELRRIQAKKAELQKEVDRLREIAEKAQLDALKAEEDVANIMLLAEQAVAYELEATQRVNDAELALQKAEKAVLSIDAADQQVPSSQEQIVNEESTGAEEVTFGDGEDATIGKNEEVLVSDNLLAADIVGQNGEGSSLFDDMHDQENGKLSFEKEEEVEADKSNNVYQKKKQDIQQKEFTKDSPLTAPKALLKKSSRFFSASFFSSNEDEEFTPSSVFHELITSARKQAPKLVLGALLIGMG